MENMETRQDTRDRVLALLCSGSRTAGELAQELGISANGVRGHLLILRDAVLVEYVVVRRGVGKPAHEYRLTTEGSARLSRAYLPLLSALLTAMIRHGGPEEAVMLMKAAGEILAEGLPRPGGELRNRAAAAVEIIAELGGDASIAVEEDGIVIQGRCCVVRALLPDHPDVCKAVESMVSTFIGASVREDCDRQTPPACRLLVGRMAAAGLEQNE